MTPIRERESVRVRVRLALWSRRMCLSAALLMLGCGGIDTDYSGLNLQEISGIVTFDGDPVVGATVIFEAEDKSFSSGVTDESGYYELMFNSEQSGVLPGVKVVRIGMTLGAADAEAAEAGVDGGESDDETPVSEDTIPPCYNSDSKLRATVSESATMNFDLKSDCSTTGPAT